MLKNILADKWFRKELRWEYFCEKIRQSDVGPSIEEFCLFQFDFGEDWLGW